MNGNWICACPGDKIDDGFGGCVCPTNSTSSSDVNIGNDVCECSNPDQTLVNGVCTCTNANKIAN